MDLNEGFKLFAIYLAFLGQLNDADTTTNW